MNRSRKGFSLLLAIIVMITIATLMALMISLSTTTAKQTSDIYVSEQTKLLARSATELALLAISGHNNSANCIENINFTYQTNYDVNMRKNYTKAIIYTFLDRIPPEGKSKLSYILF